MFSTEEKVSETTLTDGFDSNPIVISVQQVYKSFKRYDRPIDRLKEMLLPGKSRATEFFALQDVSFEVRRGETVGIVGRNGSGKSTVLQLIARTLQTTSGHVESHGRISALLELGSGFNPEFSGRDNVFFNGQILGLSEVEIGRRFDEIEAFAEIGEFIDQPVKTYSSGMLVRLAFSVAVMVEPDILIVDEALAVGDIYFQQKCFEKIRKLKDQGTTILFVSHDAGAVYQLCDRAILLNQGKLLLDGPPRAVLDLYEAKLWESLDESEEKFEIELIETPKGEEIGQISVQRPEVTVQSVHFATPEGLRTESVLVSHPVHLRVRVMFDKDFDDPHIGLSLRDRLGAEMYGTNTYTLQKKLGAVRAGEAIELCFELTAHLKPATYTVAIGVANQGYGIGSFREILTYTHSIASLNVLTNRDIAHWAGVVNLSCRMIDSARHCPDSPPLEPPIL
jgi:lipopolysaccharide transport system ATP-binding protein